jgi:uncharacterized protein YecT (DUF1311 family)
MRSFLLAIVLASSLLSAVACDDERQAEAAASHARDSSLKHDLELARADSTSSAPVAMREGASRRTVAESPGIVDVALPAGSATPVASTALNASNTRTPSAEGYIGPSCASPALDDQRRCLLGYLARSDAYLDRSYQALIGQLKSEAGSRKGAPEPPTVQRLRNAQRAWLVYRDDECRKRTRDDEGQLWAPVRAKCLAEYSALRAGEFEDALTKRRALTTREPASKAKSASGRKAKSTSGRKATRPRANRGR